MFISETSRLIIYEKYKSITQNKLSKSRAISLQKAAHCRGSKGVISHFKTRQDTKQKKYITVRQKMNEILQNSNDFLDCRQYHIVGRAHRILQNTKNSSIKVVYKPKADIDDNGHPLTKEMDYKNLKEFLEDYHLTF